jgi:hypothetical protein
MINYAWKFLEITDECKSVTYFLSATDGVNTVETQGHHVFNEGTVIVPFNQITEQNLIEWVTKDLTQNGVNPLKLNLENQLNALKNNTKVDFPWLAGTFTLND